ncbi:50S ribosomal protein L25/general stress protein Ctc [bacterium]|nr:50S ribosomal protein L25/general stress protein Ctc [bacterium]
MSQVKLEAKIRKETGKGVARRLRREGRVPAVLYGHHLEEPIILDVNSKDTEKILKTNGKTGLINLSFDDENVKDQLAMLVDYQRDVFGTCLLHVDFKQVRMDEKVTVSVPVVLVGEAIGVKAGGVLEQHIREIEVECLPTDIPAHIEVDVANLDLGHHSTVAQLKAPEGVEFKADPEEMVVSVAITRAAAEADAAEETTEAAAAE